MALLGAHLLLPRVEVGPRATARLQHEDERLVGGELADGDQPVVLLNLGLQHAENHLRLGCRVEPEDEVFGVPAVLE
eukprot:4675349-Alexandrium_andersonii.AAC.1